MLQKWLPIIELVEIYLISFSECTHGMRPSVCSYCWTMPRNRPERWGYDPDASLEDNQFTWDEYQRALNKFFARAGAKTKAEKLSMGYTGTPMRVDRRPINARVRAVHVSKQGQVNVKELANKNGLVSNAYGAGRYSAVLSWGRKYCGWHGEYEKRLK